MTIKQAFIAYLQTVTDTTFGQDLFTNRVPSTPEALWCLTSSGGNPTSEAVTGEMEKDYRFDIYYRDRNPQNVDDKLFTLEETLNSSRPNLDGYTVTKVRATTFPTDNDLDDEDRYVGLLQVTISTYKE